MYDEVRLNGHLASNACRDGDLQYPERFPFTDLWCLIFIYLFFATEMRSLPSHDAMKKQAPDTSRTPKERSAGAFTLFSDAFKSKSSRDSPRVSSVDIVGLAIPCDV